jgi:hypothetical protein
MNGVSGGQIGVLTGGLDGGKIPNLKHKSPGSGFVSGPGADLSQ